MLVKELIKILKENAIQNSEVNVNEMTIELDETGKPYTKLHIAENDE